MAEQPAMQQAVARPMQNHGYPSNDHGPPPSHAQGYPDQRRMGYQDYPHQYEDEVVPQISPNLSDIARLARGRGPTLGLALSCCVV